MKKRQTEPNSYLSGPTGFDVPHGDQVLQEDQCLQGEQGLRVEKDDTISHDEPVLWKKRTITIKKREELRKELYKRDGHKCHYCGIYEDEFIPIWGVFKRKKNGTGKGKRLEIDRTDNEEGYTPKNCVLACAICNNAKSDKFTCEDFERVGKVINQILNDQYYLNE